MASTSRLVVKGLPKYLDSKKLREHFAAFAEVTDAKVCIQCLLNLTAMVAQVMTKDGESRRFGFVGFKTPKDANRARKHFDKALARPVEC